MAVQLKKSKKIPVEELRELVEYNPENGWLYSKVDRRGGCKKGDLLGGKVKDGFMVLSVYNRNYTYTHVVWALHTGSWPEKQITYLDGDRSNTKFENLALIGTVKQKGRVAPAPNNTRSAQKEIRIIVSAVKDHWHHCRERNTEMLASALRKFLENNWKNRYIEMPVRYFDNLARSAARV